MRGAPSSGFRLTEARKRLGIFSQKDLEAYEAKREANRTRGFVLTEKRKRLGIFSQKDLEAYEARKRQGITPVVPTRVAVIEAATPVETDEDIKRKIGERFGVYSTLAKAACKGDVRSLVVSGPPGLGKSFTVERIMKKYDPEGKRHQVVKGYVRPPSLYVLLFEHRRKGDVLVFDDCDSIFGDETSLNFLKAVCDSTDERVVSYKAQTELFTDDGKRVAKTFTFEGTIVFLTNYDFDGMIEKGHKLSPHLMALQSRSHYVDLAMRTKRDYFVRILQLVEDEGMLEKQRGLTVHESTQVLRFIEDHMDRLRDLSARTALKVADNYRSAPRDWEHLSRVTLCRNN